jgi:hypothetical protein
MLLKTKNAAILKVSAKSPQLNPVEYMCWMVHKPTSFSVVAVVVVYFVYSSNFNSSNIADQIYRAPIDSRSLSSERVTLLK